MAKNYKMGTRRDGKKERKKKKWGGGADIEPDMGFVAIGFLIVLSES